MPKQTKKEEKKAKPPVVSMEDRMTMLEESFCDHLVEFHGYQSHVAEDGVREVFRTLEVAPALHPLQEGS